MNLPPYLARAAVPFLVSLVCAACGGNPARETSQSAEAAAVGNYFAGTRPIYATLVSERGGSWVFGNVTDSDASPDKGFLVRLNDLTPAFDTRLAECFPQIYPELHRCSPLHPFRDEDAGVLNKIINGSIAVGTAGKITDITQSYETTFDEAAFNRAVDEALLNTGLDTGRRPLIALIENHDRQLEEARNVLSEQSREISKARAATARLPLEIQPRIKGLTGYYEGDVDFRELVDVRPAGDAKVPEVQLERRSILPCDARECNVKAQRALVKLQQDVRQQEQQFATMLQPDSRIYDVHCQDGMYGSYLLSADCPAQLKLTGDEAARLPISVTILSRDFDDLYPAFDVADERLRVEVGDRAVTFVNTTDEYVTLTAQTVYYNSKVHTSSHLIDIPPGISITRAMDDFVSQSIDIESSYRQMTPDKAAGASFRFGFAVRYRIGSQPEEETLHGQQAFNVGCVIENQMRPGSCQPDSLADAGEQEPTTGTQPRRAGPM